MADARNWIKRRALRDKVLADRELLANVWEDARAAIQDCCTSFREHYAGLATVEDKLENGHRIKIKITFLDSALPSRRVQIALNGRSIAVTVDDSNSREFKIDGDETRQFLVDHQGHEISGDAFSRKALEDALFKPPVPPRQHRPAPPPLSPYS